MTENKTSYAVHHLLESLAVESGDLQLPLTKENRVILHAIIKKFTLMEQACHVAWRKASVEGSDLGLIQRLEEALSYDPLQ